MYIFVWIKRTRSISSSFLGGILGQENKLTRDLRLWPDETPRSQQRTPERTHLSCKYLSGSRRQYEELLFIRGGPPLEVCLVRLTIHPSKGRG